jgi:hypothetical protein
MELASEAATPLPCSHHPLRRALLDNERAPEAALARLARHILTVARIERDLRRPQLVERDVSDREGRQSAL